jgi:ketosteroid isomerase-like protein
MKSSKQLFLERFNQAFADSDTAFLLNGVTDDIRWTVAGDQTIEGKEQFAGMLQQMEQDEPLKLTIENVITHGRSAAVNGVMKSAGGTRYAFCDVYKFSSSKDPKIREMTSYAVEI